MRRVCVDITSIRFLPDRYPTSFHLGRRTTYPKCSPQFGLDGGIMSVGNSVLIHTAQTPEELAAIPEPGTWALGLSGMLGAGWFAKRRRRR